MTQVDHGSREVRKDVTISERVGGHALCCPDTKTKATGGASLLSPWCCEFSRLAGHVVVRIERRSRGGRGIGVTAGGGHAGILGADEPGVDNGIGIDVTRRL